MTLMRATLGPNGLFTDPFAPLRELEKMMAASSQPAYPPFNMVQTAEDKFRLEFAVAGFTKKDISVTVNDRNLVIKGAQENKTEEKYIHRGIAMRKFLRTFRLPEFMEVASATMTDGILRIELTRVIPEERKPKEIQVK